MEFETLVAKLDSDTKHLLEQSVAEASSRSHYAVDVSHLIFKLSASADNSLYPHINDCGCNTATLNEQASVTLGREKTGNGGFPKIAPDIVRLLFDAWILATTEFQQTHISTLHIVIALVESEALRLKVQHSLPELVELNTTTLRNNYARIEQTNANQQSTTSPAGQTNLAQYTINLTASARAGKIESIVGRDDEVRQIIDILSRKKQNNPILTGEAGVGKTAVVEGLALKIAQGQVPLSLRDVELHSLDMGLLQAGAGVKGEFENRLKGIIKEVQNMRESHHFIYRRSPHPNRRGPTIRSG